ncbi:MAG: chromosomal replication initiator protein DnaA [Lachnospiraceae bacterium]|nr:chromosomal replication initiator protein DnaA [Lachnospiraceae bacterium]
MELIKEQWELIKETVRDEYNLTDVSYKTWINPLEIHCVKDKNVYIIIPSDKAGASDYISKKYKMFFQVTISEMFSDNYDVTFILEKDTIGIDKKNAEMNSHTPVYNINYENANLNPKYKFDTFVVGSNNKFAHSASLAVAESPGEAYNPLYLYGGAGLGKTHLMHSIGHFILEQDPNKKVLYVTSEDFTNEVIESIRSGNAAAMTKLRDKYRTVDVLMVDDVQFIIGKESTQEEFFHTFNVLHSAGKQIIISSDRPPKEMETLDERFRSRFEWGLIADIQAPDYETRMAILRKNAEGYDKKIDEEIINYIATNIKSNIRELEGAFNKIIAFVRLNNISSEDLSIQVAEEALKDIIYPDKPKEITPSLILNVVCEHFGVKPEDITSKKRNSEFVLPRQIVMYLCRTYTATSLQGVGKLLGKKDHTTIIHGVEKIKEELETNEELRNKVEIIKKKLNPS